MKKFLYGLLEVVSVAFGFMAAAILFNYDEVLWQWSSFMAHALDSSFQSIIDVTVFTTRVAFLAVTPFACATLASMGAAATAKGLGPEVYAHLNNKYHKWCVVVFNGVVFLGALYASYFAEAWATFALLVVAAVAYAVFSKVIKVNPHSFAARLRSVLLVRVPIGLGLGFMMPFDTWVPKVIILVTLAGALMASFSLWEDAKRYNWPPR